MYFCVVYVCDYVQIDLALEQGYQLGLGIGNQIIKQLQSEPNTCLLARKKIKTKQFEIKDK